MKRRLRSLTLLAMGCAAGLCLASCTYLGADNAPRLHSPGANQSSAPSTDASSDAEGRRILRDSMDALQTVMEVKVSAKGTTDGVPFSYEVSGDYDFANLQAFEMRDGKGHVQWLADGSTSTYFVKANKWHGDLIEPTDHVDFLDALREDRWLMLPKSEAASMILASDEIDELIDFIEASVDYKHMKYQGVHDLGGVPAHRFSSPESTLWLSNTSSPLPMRLETVSYDPYTRMTSTYRDWDEEILLDLPVKGEYATVSERTNRKA